MPPLLKTKKFHPQLWPHWLDRWHLGDRCMLLPMYVHTYVVLLSSMYLLLQFLFLVFDIIWSDSIITMIFTCQSVTIKMHRTQTDSIFNSTHGVWSFCFLHVTFGHTYFLYKIPQKWLAFFCSNWGLLCKNDVSLFNDWPKSVFSFLTY